MVSEFFVQKFIPFQAHTDERNLTYDHDLELGWFPKKNSTKKFEGSKIIDVTHNSLGFRDIEYQPNNKPNIIFLGDSFTWGYDVQVDERFTEKLRRKFQNKFNILNFGVSGYGTDQEFLLLKKYYDQFKPKIVFVIFCNNDFYNNSNNIVYNGYQKPYFVSENDKLEVKGLPIEISTNYKMLNFDKDHPILSKSHLIKWIAKLYGRVKYNLQKNHNIKDPTYQILEEMDKYLIQKVGKLVVATIDYQTEMERFFAEKNISYVNLNNNFRFTSHGNHWTKEGHDFAAKKITEKILDLQN